MRYLQFKIGKRRFVVNQDYIVAMEENERRTVTIHMDDETDIETDTPFDDVFPDDEVIENIYIKPSDN